VSGTICCHPGAVRCVDVVQNAIGFGDAHKQVSRFRQYPVEGSIVMTRGVETRRCAALIDSMSRTVLRSARRAEQNLRMFANVGKAVAIKILHAQTSRVGLRIR